MDYGKEFKKFAIKDQGVSSTYYDSILTSMYPVGLTPNIIEERQMNAVSMDVFSRLMMDRIIFLGTGINDQVANIIGCQVTTDQSVQDAWQLLTEFLQFLNGFSVIYKI